VRLLSRVGAIVVVVGGAVVAASCASFGASSEPTPAATEDSGPAAAEGGTEAGANVDGGAPLDAQPGTPLQCPQSAILCDTFEDRGGSTTDLTGTRWGALAGVATGRIDGAMSFSPAHSLAIDVPAGTSGKTVGLEAKRVIAGTGVTLRAAIRLSALPPYAQLISMVADSEFFSVIVDNGNLVAQYRDGTNRYAYIRTSAVPPLDQWFHVTFELRFGPGGGVRLLLDGLPIHEKAATTTDSPTIKNFTLVVDPDFGSGGTPTTEALTIHYDDIVLE
jgi:hypothetical protein